MMLDLSKLNAPQRQAVTHGQGPLLIFAGAGSGKTGVLTNRIAYLLEQGMATPGEILAVTFTNKAAREMRNRVANLTKDPNLQMRIGTFHSTAMRMLWRDAHHLGFTRRFSIYDEDDSKAVMKRALVENDLDPKKFAPASLLEAVSKAKSELVKPEDYPIGEKGEQMVQAVYTTYQDLLKRANAMDFDDLINNFVYLLQDNQEVREYWQNRFRYVLVDEYQDTNHAQYMMLKILSEKHHNLTVVGDDDQSIYAFRGADIRNILDFQKDFPGATVVKLEQNYRSHQSILDVAYNVIVQNTDRAQKKLWSAQSEGLLPQAVLCRSDDEEASFVANEIFELAENEQMAWSSFAVLYRTNAQSRSIERELAKRRIPYRVVGGLRFWDRMEVKDAMAYLKLLHNPNDAASFQRIANVPKRKVGAKTINAIVSAAHDRSATILDVLAQPALADLRADGRAAVAALGQELHPLVAASDAKPSALLDMLFDRIGLRAHYADYDNDPRRTELRLDNLAELRGYAADFDHLPPDRALTAFLADVSLASDVDKLDEGNNTVTLITLHMVKGLEFDVCFLTGMEEGMLPHKNALEEVGGVAEERRLAYVGITRARNRLYITTCNERHLFGSTISLSPSRFWADIPGAMLDLIQSPYHRSQALASHIQQGHRQAAQALGLASESDLGFP